jgi:hypothetical protein
MDHNTMTIAIAGLVCGTVMFITVVSLWMRRRADPVPRDGLRSIEARLGELQQSIDSIAVEVERVSEGQRFATKLLAERVERGDRAERGVGERLAK